ncbi:MAG: hypothetical protein J2P36_30385 [Ktedonobacteraceae bacterium]|nr:hypothetical protein [Ktedonobacteraceae bacterium]
MDEIKGPKEEPQQGDQLGGASTGRDDNFTRLTVKTGGDPGDDTIPQVV